MPAMLKGWFDKTLVPGPGGAWDFPKPGVASSAGLAGLVPLLTNVKRIAAVSTCALHARISLPARPPAARSVVAGRYGAPHHIAMLAGDNGRNTVWPPRRKCGRPPAHAACACRDVHAFAQVATALRAVFDPACTCKWLGLYRMDDAGPQERRSFVEHVRTTIARDF